MRGARVLSVSKEEDDKMTICESCRNPMRITTAQYDIGEGIEELDVEICQKCNIIHVDSVERRVIAG